MGAINGILMGVYAVVYVSSQASDMNIYYSSMDNCPNLVFYRTEKLLLRCSRVRKVKLLLQISEREVKHLYPERNYQRRNLKDQLKKILLLLRFVLASFISLQGSN